MNSLKRILAICCILLLGLTSLATAQPGTVLSHQKISDTQGGFTGTLLDGDGFGCALGTLGDVDGDGVVDIVSEGHVHTKERLILNVGKFGYYFST